MLRKLLTALALFVVVPAQANNTFTCPANGTASQQVSLSPGAYIASAKVTGANMEIKTTAIVYSVNNLVSQVTPLATADYWLGSLTIEPIGGTSAQWRFDQSRDLGIQLVCSGDNSADRTVVYTISKID